MSGRIMGLVRNVLVPKPMSFEDKVYVFNGDTFGLREEQVNENSHNNNKAGKEKEQTELEVAKHGEKGLSNGEGEDHVHCHVDGLP